MSEPQHGRHRASTTEDGDRDAGVRLELKTGTARTGRVDGGWWPRSRDLEAELPGLVAALTARLGARLGPIMRIGFGVHQWDTTGKRHLTTPTGRIALDGFRHFDAGLLWAASHSTAMTPIALVVVPPDTPADRAAATLRRASTADNTERPEELLGQPDATRDREADAVAAMPGAGDTVGGIVR